MHPRTPSFDELHAVAVGRVTQAGGNKFVGERSELLSELFSLFSYRAVLGHLQPCSVHVSVSEYPKASALARRQAAEGWGSIATVHHLGLSIDAFASHLLQALDGTQTVPDIVKRLHQEVEAGVLQVPGGKQAQTSGKGLEKEIHDNIHHLLRVFARHGLLVPV